jgi:hypothetical protein
MYLKLGCELRTLGSSTFFYSSFKSKLRGRLVNGIAAPFVNALVDWEMIATGVWILNFKLKVER